MIRLNCIVEGQTEEAFINSILVTHLANLGVYASVRCVATRRDGPTFRRGGLSDYGKAKRDILAWVHQDRNSDARFTTMFDFYALPSDFPGFESAMRVSDPYERIAILERAIKGDIDDQRFIPYFQLHEFEALLLANPSKLDVEFFDHPDAIEALTEVSDGFDTPELIDLGATTAPSKRIIAAIPEYQYRKMTSGPIVAAAIGLETLRSKCPHFGSWLDRLENLNPSNAQ